MTNFKKVNTVYPEQVIIYRDGVSSTQLEACFKDEIRPIKKALKKLGADNTKFEFIVVQKRINNRFVTFDSKQTVHEGTVISHDVTSNQFWDWFLVPCSRVLLLIASIVSNLILAVISYLLISRVVWKKTTRREYHKADGTTESDFIEEDLFTPAQERAAKWAANLILMFVWSFFDFPSHMARAVRKASSLTNKSHCMTCFSLFIARLFVLFCCCFCQQEPSKKKDLWRWLKWRRKQVRRAACCVVFWQIGLCVSCCWFVIFASESEDDYYKRYEENDSVEYEGWNYYEGECSANLAAPTTPKYDKYRDASIDETVPLDMQSRIESFLLEFLKNLAISWLGYKMFCPVKDMLFYCYGYKQRMNQQVRYRCGCCCPRKPKPYKVSYGDIQSLRAVPAPDAEAPASPRAMDDPSPVNALREPTPDSARHQSLTPGATPKPKQHGATPRSQPGLVSPPHRRIQEMMLRQRELRSKRGSPRA